MSVIKRFLNNESGATAIEYGLIAVGIAVAIIATVNLAGDQLVITFQRITTALTAGNAQ